jgi:copper chaperone CopZ
MVHAELRIQGMSCNHCVMHVRKKLQSIDGVDVKEVLIGSATIDYDDTKVSPEQLKAAVEQAGYAIAS